MKELKSMCALRTCGTAVTLEERSSRFTTVHIWCVGPYYTHWCRVMRGDRCAGCPGRVCAQTPKQAVVDKRSALRHCRWHVRPPRRRPRVATRERPIRARASGSGHSAGGRYTCYNLHLQCPDNKQLTSNTVRAHLWLRAVAFARARARARALGLALGGGRVQVHL